MLLHLSERSWIVSVAAADVLAEGWRFRIRCVHASSFDAVPLELGHVGSLVPLADFQAAVATRGSHFVRRERERTLRILL